ncbi:hypothetical protein EST38_g5449 [Candolleomyces aberdarensis]|uniref:NYN domain-containing protein n=1 Tax=Candolleomyces aberdarensis TaxID=2316362 RepID=A0A4Q2DNM0_9AGAR|nr:hypothetical protein EST38_g5449 [Candolleomyces aberdarensis]
MPSDTASTSSRVSIPISPAFSTDTVSSAPNSEPTSDEQPDLGAFTTVFWAWNNLQPHPRHPMPQFHPPPSSRTSRLEESSISSFTHPGLSEASGTESPPPADTVWAQRQLHSYFNINSITPSSEQVQELEDEEDEYEVRVNNDNPEAEYRESPPPPSPLSEDSRTVEIFEAASDIDIPDTESFAESLDQSTAGADMALPVTVFSPNRDTPVGLQASEEGDNSSLTSREHPLRDANGYQPYSFHRSSAHQIPSLRGHDVQITPRRAEFPIHDLNTVQAGRHTKGPSFSPQIEPPSPLPTPDDNNSEVIIPYSPAQRAVLVDDEYEDDSHTPTRRPVARGGRGGGSVEQQQQQGQREHEYEQYLQQGAMHPYPHPLLGHHVLPTTYQPFKGPGFDPEPPSQQEHPTANSNGGAAYVDYQEDDGCIPEEHPSLGLLDEALGFIAAERARLEANREAGLSHPLPMDATAMVPREWQHVVEPKRKRRRKKPITTATATATATATVKDHHPNGHLGVVAPASPSLTATSMTTVSGLSATRPLLLAATAPSTADKDKDKKKDVTAFNQDDDDHHQDDGLLPPTDTMALATTTKTKNKKPKSSSSSSSAAKKVDPEGKERQRQEEEQKSNLLNRKAPNKTTTTTTTTDSTYGPDVKHITILSRPKKAQTQLQAGISNAGVNGDKDPVATAEGVGEGGGIGPGGDEPQPLVLTGKKGNRVGRKERERAKAKRDKERAALLLQQASEPREPARGRHDDWDVDEGDLDQDDEDGDHGEDDAKEDDDDGEGEIGFFSSSPAAGDTLARPYKGAATGTPGTATPRTTKFDVNLTLNLGAEDDERRGRSRPGLRENGDAKGERELKQQQSTAEEALQASPPSKRSRKSRTRRAAKTLVHAKSFPNLGSGELGLEDDEIEVELVSDPSVSVDQSKRKRLTALTHKLQVLFPEQKKDLKKVLQRLEGGGSGRTPAAVTSGSDKGPTSTGKKRKGHVRHGSGKGGSGSYSTPSLSLFSTEDSSVEEQEQDPAEFDVTGNPRGEGGALIHIFIDHSNILIGMLNFLKRYPPPQSVIDEYLSSAGSKLNLASRSTTALVDSKDGVASSQSFKATTAITIPTSTKRSQAIPIIESPLESRGEEDDEYPITLPSFATARVKASRVKAKAKDRQEDSVGFELSRSLPTESVLDAQMARRRIAKTSIQGVISDGYEDQDQSQDDGVVKVVSVVEKVRKVKRFPKHLWHAALVLVLERGRAVSRRVVVTSSPLYQPMEKIQKLGYEVRVYIRVPDLGDGMDRERKDGKHAVGATRPTYGGKASSAQPPNTSSQKKTHIRHLSGSTSADSGSGSGPVVASGTGTPSKIRYREQGVDELLQLKLHQAIADADTVPKGSTIVLATGDGNVGQFNEDGFLGPVRTALKRGWKVELYAWEDGLSRSWRREFGENSEWGRKGLFSIIPLEQFATSLVEASGW